MILVILYYSERCGDILQDKIQYAVGRCRQDIIDTVISIVTSNDEYREQLYNIWSTNYDWREFSDKVTVYTGWRLRWEYPDLL